MKDVVIKKSKIHGKGVFANRIFLKGEVVLKWNPRVLKKSELNKITEKQKHYVYKTNNGKNLLMSSPEKYVNHSIKPNTKVKGYGDVAIRIVKKGEEITSDYKTQLL